MSLSRRRFLGRAAPLSMLPFLAGCESHGRSTRGGALSTGAAASVDPFQHGVASGDPLRDAVILWTRVTPPANQADQEIAVRWRVALDSGMTQLVREGTARTDASRDYTVKVDVTELGAGTTYYYDFLALELRSPVGRTRTLPTGAVPRARIAVACCANYPAGYFNAYRLIAERGDLDVVLHLGDYLYEYGNGTLGDGTAMGRIPSPDRELITLEEYRQRHAQYKLDPDLQEAHRQHPFIAVWDDHEVANNAFRDGAANHQPDAEGEWAERRAAAMQAYHEWMPIRAPVPGDTTRVYRAFAWGDLLDLVLLDTRSARDARIAGNCDPAGLSDASRSLLGAAQEEWVLGRLTESRARGTRWRVIGQQVMFGQLSDGATGCVSHPDQWDGYPLSRGRMLATLREGIDNVIILTGDAHSSWAFDLAEDPFDPASYSGATGQGSLAVEFVAPAVSSPGPSLEMGPEQLLDTHPHLKFVELERRGYLLLDLTAERAQAEWYFVHTVEEILATEELGAVFQARAGEGRLTRGGEPSARGENPPEPAP